jgi:membrane-associated protein
MTADATGLLGLSGYALIAVVCGLILLEEIGIPMPFAPGDFLLVLAGMSIATAHLNPLVVVAATYVAALLGAIGGREVFEHLGIAALPRIEALLHAGDRVEALKLKLRRRGALAVFLGRLTPGLRVVTTYVSGLIGMPRQTFLRGLAPGIAVYQAVFVGLGVWLGPAAWATIERHEPKPGQLLLVLLVVAGSVLAGHTLVRRVHAPAVKRGDVMEVHA